MNFLFNNIIITESNRKSGIVTRNTYQDELKLFLETIVTSFLLLNRKMMQIS